MNEENYKVLAKIIGAVETGGQVYGNARYDDYTAPYTNTPGEHTITLGWPQFYGDEAKRLIQLILEKDESEFRRIDTGGLIEKRLKTDWVITRWNPSAKEKRILINLIDSDAGHEAQDELFTELMKSFVADCDYTTDDKAVMMYCAYQPSSHRSVSTSPIRLQATRSATPSSGPAIRNAPSS